MTTIRLLLAYYYYSLKGIVSVAGFFPVYMKLWASTVLIQLIFRRLSNIHRVHSFASVVSGNQSDD